MICLLTLTYLTLSAWAATTLASCNPDNCLRAVRASQFPTRTLACRSYFSTVITPAPIVVTITNTISVTNTENISLTNTLHATTFETKTFTATSEIPKTTVTVTSITDIILVRRQQTAVPSAIPAFASPCSGSVRFSSACSCVGATAKTVVLAPVTITVHVDQTVSAFTTKTTTVDKTVTDTTITVPITDSTRTVTIASTATVVQGIALRKSLAIKVIRANVAEPVELGYITPGNSPRNSLYGSVGPVPYKFWYDDAGYLTSAAGRLGLQYFSDFHPMAFGSIGGAFYPTDTTLNADRTITNWGINYPGLGGRVRNLFTFYAPGTPDQYLVFVNSDVPVSSPRGVGWWDVTFKAEVF
ncbi:hypothetical protein ABW20_dc0109176 [Dactylellina cionopaga]|nr:hypothetical protein ABW20_dc0109176 [Dactylellina cionopaga]